YQDANQAWQKETENTVPNLTLVLLPYVDLKLVPSSSAQIDETRLQAAAAMGAALFRLKDKNNTVIQPTSAMVIGDGKIRYFFTAPLSAGVYTAETLAGWQDSSSATNEARTYSFEVVVPHAEIAAPFSSTRPVVDINVANNQSPNRYIDV